MGGGNMKEFNTKKFCNDLVSLRGRESQTNFADKMGVKRSTLSLLENGKQLPTLDILIRLCELSNRKTDDYFEETTKDALVYLMGNLKESDRERIEEMSERIRIREKYELLAKRRSYDVD
jgi:transcriptional regulator with XRE-family HTH domain